MKSLAPRQLPVQNAGAHEIIQNAWHAFFLATLATALHARAGDQPLR
jgi:hypothetical protein